MARQHVFDDREAEARAARVARPAGVGAIEPFEQVRQVFGNVPARRAFLRAPQTEWSHASEAFVHTALAHPEVGFTLTHNGRLVHDLPATSAWRERIGGLFGTKMAERLIEVEASDEDVRLAGLVGRPADDQASGRLQHVFVAGRPFRDRSILHAVQEGDGVDDARVRARLLGEYSVEIGGGLGVLKGRVWRIGLMGHGATRRNVLTALAALSAALSAEGWRPRNDPIEAARSAFAS